jgi:hypothetical protein
VTTCDKTRCFANLSGPGLAVELLLPCLLNKVIKSIIVAENRYKSSVVKTYHYWPGKNIPFCFIHSRAFCSFHMIFWHESKKSKQGSCRDIGHALVDRGFENDTSQCRNTATSVSLPSEDTISESSQVLQIRAP